MIKIALTQWLFYDLAARDICSIKKVGQIRFDKSSLKNCFKNIAF